MPYHRVLLLAALWAALSLTACTKAEDTGPAGTQAGTPAAGSAAVPGTVVPTDPGPGDAGSPAAAPPSAQPGGSPVTSPGVSPSAGPGSGSQGGSGSGRLELSLSQRFLDQLGATTRIQIRMFDAQGREVPVDPARLSFSSSRPEDFSVDASGLVKALKENGFAEIRVQLIGTDLSAVQLVSVSAADAAAGSGGGGGAPAPTPTPLEDLNVDVEFEGLEEAE